MTRDEALYWFKLGRHGCTAGPEEMVVFESLWSSRHVPVEGLVEVETGWCTCDPRGEVHGKPGVSHYSGCPLWNRNAPKWTPPVLPKKPITWERNDCLGTLHVVGNLATCSECDYSCNWLHRPEEDWHTPVLTESSPKALEVETPPVVVEEENGGLRACGGRIRYSSWQSAWVCGECEDSYDGGVAITLGYHCSSMR